MLNLGTAMRVGATVGLIRKFSASKFSDDIHRYGATFVNYVGRALSYVLNKPEDPRDRTGTLEVAFGTEASEVDIARFTERFGCVVIEGYGSSEGVIRINRTPECPTGSLGVVSGDVDVRIMNEETDEECPPARFDETGRLLNSEAVGQIVSIGGAAAFEGYYKNPGAAAERVKGDDFWTGDLAYRDADGFFYFAGRASDWLRVDSENFSAAPLERILLRVSGILSAPVFAVPDPATGDQVMCAVELDAGAVFDPEVFGQTLAEQPDMGDKWWPRFVRVTDHVPLTGSNKIDKAPLRAAAWSTETRSISGSAALTSTSCSTTKHARASNVTSRSRAGRRFCPLRSRRHSRVSPSGTVSSVVTSLTYGGGSTALSTRTYRVCDRSEPRPEQHRSTPTSERTDDREPGNVRRHRNP